MPADSKRKQKATKTVKNPAEMSFDSCGEGSAPADEAPAAKVSRKRSPSPNESENESDGETNMPTMNTNSPEKLEIGAMLNSFGTDVSKTLAAKRKKLAGFTSAAMKTSNKRYEDIFVQQQSQREKIICEYEKKVGNVFTQWDSDTSKAKEADEKVETIIRQLQKSLQQQRVVQNQRQSSVRSMHEQFVKTMREMAVIHREQQSNIHGELRKELANLQKKMMEDEKEKEMITMRRSLQSMLAQV